MTERSPRAAVNNALNPMKRAAGFITNVPLALLSHSPLKAGDVFGASVNEGQPFRLDSTTRGLLWIIVSTNFRILADPEVAKSYRVTTLK